MILAFFVFSILLKLKVFFVKQSERIAMKLEISRGGDCNNLLYYCHLELWDYVTHLKHDSFEMPFTACPNRELLFLSFMVEKMKISTHSKRDKAEKFPFYFFLYFALLNFGRSLEVRKNVYL